MSPMGKQAKRCIVLLLVAGVAGGCEPSVPAIGFTLRNMSKETIFEPKVVYGQAVFDSGEQNMLSTRSEAGEFGQFNTPDTAKLSWINEGQSCDAVYEVRRTAESTEEFNSSELYFEIDGLDSKAYIDRYQTRTDDPLIPFPRLSQACKEIPNWKAPPECTITNCP